MSIFRASPGESVLSYMGKGALTGGTLAAAGLGLLELKDFIDNLVIPKSKTVITFGEEREEPEKAASYAFDYPQKFGYGASAVGGAYGMWELLSYIKEKYYESKALGRLEDLKSSLEQEQTSNEKRQSDLKDRERSIYFSNESSFSKESAFEKKASLQRNLTIMAYVNAMDQVHQLEKNAEILDDINQKAKSLWDSSYNIGTGVVEGGKGLLSGLGSMVDNFPSTVELSKKIVGEWWPMLLGGIAATSAIGGWEAGKQLFNPLSSDSAPLKTNLVYKFVEGKEDDRENSD